MQLELVPTASATPVSISAPSGAYTYLVRNREGVILAVFSVDSPGTYSLTSLYANGESQPQIVLAIVQGSPEDLFVSRPLLNDLGALLGLGLLLVSLVIGAVTVFFRIRAKDRAGPARSLGPEA
ncbi:MAG TPA: hypothetical protein VKI99_06995 [Candidatus Dormibacteraeota bacterium]|nr:hypothetical protein [Candidatus Dormibacteraeota bacterium]